MVFGEPNRERESKQGLLGQTGDDQIVAAAEVAFEFGRGQGGEILDFHPHPFCAIRGLGNAVDFGERIEVGRIAFEDDGVGEIGVEGDDEKYFAGDLNPSSAVGAGSENSFRGERFFQRGGLRGKLIFLSDGVPNTPL